MSKYPISQYPLRLSEPLLCELPRRVREFVEEVDTSISRKVTVEQDLQIVNNLYICTVCNKYNPEGASCERENCPW